MQSIQYVIVIEEMLRSILMYVSRRLLELGATLSIRLRGYTRHSRIRLNLTKYKASFSRHKRLEVAIATLPLQRHITRHFATERCGQVICVM
jgi:hypothetical protein